MNQQKWAIMPGVKSVERKIWRCSIQ